MSENNLNKYLKLLAIISLIILIGYVLLQIGSYFMSLVTILGIAIVLTYILLEPVNILQKLLPGIPELRIHPQTLDLKKFKLSTPGFAIAFNKKIISILTVYILFVLIVLFLAVRLIPPTISQVGDLARNIPNYVNQAEEVLEDSINFIHKNFPQVSIPGLTKLKPEQDRLGDLAQRSIPIIIHEKPQDSDMITTYQTELYPGQGKEDIGTGVSKEELIAVKNKIAENLANELLGWAQGNAQKALSNILAVATNTITVIGYVLTVFVLSFYFLMDGKNLVNGLNLLLPESILPKIEELEAGIHNSLLGFLKGQVFLGIITGFVMWIVYAFFGVPYALFLAIALAIAEVIPVVGTYLGFIPALIVMLFTDPLGQLPWVWLIFFIVQTIKDNILAPKIVGDIIGLHPVTVILSLWIGYQVAGFLGILFAIPVASILNVILTFIMRERAKSKETLSS